MQKIFCWLFFLGFTVGLCAQQNVEDSLNKVIAEYKDEAQVARAYNALGYEYTRKDVARSKGYFASAIAIGKKINNLKRLSASYSALVYLFHDAGRPDSAEYYIDLVKGLAQQANESEKDALQSNYNTVAALYYKKTGAYKKAIPFFENAIAILIRMGDKESTAGQTLNLGNTYVELGNYQKATAQHLAALRLFEEVGSERGISFCYQSLSNSFTRLKQYNKALIYANKSLKIKTAVNDRLGLGTAQSGLGDIYFGLNDLDKALYHFTAALHIAQEFKHVPDQQGNYLCIAKVYKAKNEIKKAIEYFNQSKQLASQLKDSSSVAAIDAELIALQYADRNIVLSENKLKTTLQLFQEQGDLNRQASGFRNMVDFYTANKQFDKALEYTNKYHQAVDSIQNNDLQLQVKKMEELYNVDKKEKEITILKIDQQLSQAQLQKQKVFQYAAILLLILLLLIGLLAFNRNKLRQKMKELELRNQIAADLHDEVGSSLSSIHMLSQMATQQDNDTTHKDILARMSNNAKETMDKMSDIVWMIKPGETEATTLKQRMERFAYEISGSKNIEMSMYLDNLEKVKLSMAQRKNIWLIFKEAVNNAVKYSGTQKIDISTAINNNGLLLQIKDWGKGFNSSNIKKGNGLDNMQLRAKELGAILKLESAAATGTVIQLTLPV